MKTEFRNQLAIGIPIGDLTLNEIDILCKTYDLEVDVKQKMIKVIEIEYI